MEATPVLWHLKVSHYNEKARWALDYKRVPHVRRAVLPGRHAAVARRLSGGQTFPVLVLGEEAIGDSTRIRRCIPPTPRRAGGLSSSRTTSTRSWAPTCGCW